ncbi:peptidoglycan DD-metalloendopeptidase family protein [Massilia sp. S19_KUP03_FR1]|uniref:peptidoglycan DD-metalloendopeptidase family protein n=1 Tax=Massilia sp. S19_KUP03_FR1 TaxID=3025503 RepID=UPI002FCD0D1E
MNPIPRLILLTLTIGLLSACQTSPRKGPVVVDRSIGASSSNYRPVTPPPVVIEEIRGDAKGSYTVRRGDTLLRIALDHGQNYRDLVAWNSLTDANDIKVGQVLRVAPASAPGERPATGVTTSAISMPPSDTRSTTAPAAPKKPLPVAPPRVVDARPAEGALAPAVPSVAAPALSDEDKVSWMWPSEGKIIGTFEEGKNKGIDIAGKLGQRVLAASGGKVMYAGSGIRGYGNLVIVKHSNNVLSAYAHNRAIVVKEGDPVVKGQTIAEMGNSDADSVKLHFEIRQQGKPVDPSRFLPSR